LPALPACRVAPAGRNPTYELFDRINTFNRIPVNPVNPVNTVNTVNSVKQDFLTKVQFMAA